MPSTPSPRGSDLPPWLRGANRGARPDQGVARKAARLAPFALILFGGGVATGVMLANRRSTAPVAAAASVCPSPSVPPVVSCPERPGATGKAGGGAGIPGHLAAAPHRAHTPAAKPLMPLPEAKPLDDERRTQALRAFAEQKAPELRDCLSEPDRGPPLKLGAAFEIGANGAVDFVQILGADTSPNNVRRCYSARLKRWRFPQALLRGEEKLLVNFVL